eukprot:CAMPEP_0179026736 /NCGR_PEP_ID=MMETSP0796-20121207/8673_1 /TAXON_ID=73915 /ORGANISM="Pyrodinium bahamense, Strain pbaha01" /LENGTH=183 /DNA_ID=CAMNT_0020722835 /DNA_START=77 /DNA_END=628 /DNA_ORIENTATION=-
MAAKLQRQAVVTQEAWDAYRLVAKGGLLAAVFVLSPDEQQVSLKATVQNSPGCWHDFTAQFDPQEVAWAALMLPYSTDTGGLRSKLLFLSWAPDSLRRATLKESARVKSSAVFQIGDLAGAAKRDGGRAVQANGREDLDLENVLAVAAKFERDTVVWESVLGLLERPAGTEMVADDGETPMQV